MNVLREADSRWVALLLDTEGTITVNSGGVYPHISVGMTSMPVLAELVRIVDEGSVRKRANAHGHRQMYHWQLSSQQAVAVLRQIVPHLLEKQRQARLCIALGARLSPKQRHGSGVPTVEVEHRRRMLDAVQRLNRGEDVDEAEITALCVPYKRATCANGHPWRRPHTIVVRGRTICRTCRNENASRRWAERHGAA